MQAAERYAPAGMQLHFSVEETLLDTGGGIRRMCEFLRASDPCLIVGGDMIADADIASLIARHEERDAAVTMLLRDDPRQATFGSIGVCGEGRVRRIGTRFDLGGERAAGVYTWVNVVAARACIPADSRSEAARTSSPARMQPQKTIVSMPSWQITPIGTFLRVAQIPSGA